MTWAEDDISRQIFRFGAQSIRYPRSDARAGGHNRPVVHEQKCCRMIGVVGMDRPQNADIINAGGKVW